MGIRQQIIEATANKDISVFFDGEMILVPHYQTEQFLDWLEGKGTLLGAEGFTFDGKSLKPLSDCIIDYSGGEPAESVRFHKKILTADPAFHQAHFIEFVFGDR